MTDNSLKSHSCLNFYTTMEITPPHDIARRVNFNLDFEIQIMQISGSGFSKLKYAPCINSNMWFLVKRISLINCSLQEHFKSLLAKILLI